MDLINILKKNLIKIGIIFGVLIVIIVVIWLFSGKKVHVSRSDTYTDIEKKLIKSARNYTSENKGALPEMNKMKRIKVKTLVENKYLSEIKAKNSSKLCDGYVEVTKESEEYTFRPYLDCGKEYVTTKIADKIINKGLQTTGDGLYEMNNKYVYKGDNPNNYLEVDKIKFRILSINNEGELKLIFVDQTEMFTTWDDRYNATAGSSYGINDFTRSRLKEFLEKNYDDPTFPEAIKKYITPKELCIGKRADSDDANLTDEVECSEVSKPFKTGIIQLSEFYNASLDEGCKTVQDKSCMNYNYLVKVNQDAVTITAAKDNTYEIYTVYYGKARKEHAYKSFRPNLTFYMNKNTLYAGGDGSEAKPYKVRLYQ